MRSPARNVVFDCNVYFQALISPLGPSAGCLVAATQGLIRLYASEWVIAEYLDVASRPILRTKFRITDARVSDLLAVMRRTAIVVGPVAETYSLASDPKDSHYINLALATQSELIVTRDGDLLRLMELSRREGAEFQRLFPQMRVIIPEELLRGLPRERPSDRT